MRIGFIGGNGHHYLRGALGDASVGVTAVAVAGDGHDNESARKLAGNLPTRPGLPAPAWFDDAPRMLDEFKPDYVSVGAVYAFNGECAALALERGLPVVSDKPIAANWDQFDRLESLLEKTGRVVCTEFDFRSRPEFRAAREAVAQGLVGQPVLVTAQKSYRFGAVRPGWYGDRRQYAGTILWVASHGIDALRFVTGRKHKRVFGRHGNLAKPEYPGLEDHTVNVFELEGGVTGVVHADFLRAQKAPTHGDDRLRLIGSLGQLEVRDARCTLITHEQEATDITDRARTRPMYLELLAALRGQETDLYGSAASLELAAVLLAARDAADSQSMVVIPG